MKIKHVPFSLLLALVLVVEAVPSVALDVPFFSQNNSEWAEDQLGDCRKLHIGWIAGVSEYPPKRAQGCAITSKAMLFNYYHPDYQDPGQLNICHWANGGYAGGCRVWWNETCAPPGVFFIDVVKNKELFDSIINSELAAGYPVIAGVKSKKISSHFVVITAANGTTYYINDPWDVEPIPRTMDDGSLGSYEIKALYLYHGTVTTDAPDSLFVGYPSAQTGESDPIDFAYSTPFFSAVNKQEVPIDTVHIQLTETTDTDYVTPIWDSGDISISSLADGSSSTVANNDRTPDIFYGMGNPPSAILQSGQDYIWRIRTKAGEDYSDWSSNVTIAMITTGTMTARFYEDKDTTYGTVYYTDGRPEFSELYAGGWGDYYYSYLEWNLGLAPGAQDTVSCNFFLYTHHVAPNDPYIKVRRVTSPWVEADVTKWNYPTDTPDGQVSMDKPMLNVYTVVEITDIYKGWKDGSFDNYGIKLHPTANSNTNHQLRSEDQAGIDKDPYLEVVYAVQ